MKTLKKLFAVTSIFLLFVVISSFDYKKDKQNNKVPQYSQFTNDTTPTKITIDVDGIFKDTEKALKNVTIELDKVDFNKLKHDLEVTFKDFNIDKIFNEVGDALAKLDTKEIAEKMKKEGKKFDSKEFQTDMDKAFKELNKIDLNKLKAEFKNFKIEISPEQKEKLKNNLEKIKPELEQKMKELKKDLEHINEQNKKASNKNYTNLQQMEMENELTGWPV